MEYNFFQEFELPQRPYIPPYSVKITDFGAKEGNLCTESIAAAIENVYENGGGHVIFPTGIWKTGAIHLKSNIDLHFEAGAVLDFSTNLEDYLPVVPVAFEGIRCFNYSPFIYGFELENISITGNGLFEGNGEAWWHWAKNRQGLLKLYVQGNTGVPVEERVFGTEDASLRSPFLQLIRCKNVLIEGIKFHHSPFWTVDPVWCENMIIRNIIIENQNPSPNSDGINVDACKNVIVEDCTIESAGDDLFCLKAGRNTDAREVGIPCENVIIRRCRATGKCQSGGIVIGSEMSAGVRNILAEDCNFAHNSNCIRFKSKDGRGGIVENIECRNIHMQKGLRGINITYRYAGKSIPPEDDPAIKGEYMPVFRNFWFENITCDEVELGIAIDGILDGKMENIHFKNIYMRAQTCLTADSVDGLYMENVRLKQI